jgi:type II secretory pathway component PulK
MLTATDRKPEIGAAAALRRAAGKSRAPRRDPFRPVDELGLLSRRPRALVDRVLPYLTVYGAGKLAGSSSEAARP